MTPRASAEPVPQRFERPFEKVPGMWKLQLPTKLLAIAGRGDVLGLEKLLEEHPEYLDHAAGHGRTLLWEATRRGRLEAVRFLVERGADVNIPGCYNSESHVQISPYCAARYYRRDAIAELLFANGTELDVFRAAFLGDREGVASDLEKDPELLNAEDPTDRIYFTPLIAFAVAGGSIELTRDLLDRSVIVPPYSARLLFLAGKNGRLDLMELLIERGCDARTAGALFVAASDIAVLELLLDRGTPVNLVGAGGFPPIVYVSRGDKGQRPDKVRLLLDHGADPNQRGPQGKTALHYAAKAGFDEVVALLLERGANPKLRDENGDAPLALARAAGKDSTAALLG